MELVKMCISHWLGEEARFGILAPGDVAFPWPIMVPGVRSLEFPGLKTLPPECAPKVWAFEEAGSIKPPQAEALAAIVDMRRETTQIGVECLVDRNGNTRSVERVKSPPPDF